MSIKCEVVEKGLIDSLSTAQNPRLAPGIQEHLKSCPRCQESYTRWHTIAQVLRLPLSEEEERFSRITRIMSDVQRIERTRHRVGMTHRIGLSPFIAGLRMFSLILASGWTLYILFIVAMLIARVHFGVRS